MSEFTEALNYLIRVLKKKIGDTTFSYLQPGLTYDEIEKLVKNLPIKFPPEFYELYQWKNGYKRKPEALSRKFLEYFPLEIAVEKYLAKQKHYNPSWMLENDSFSPNWFQLYPEDMELALETGYLVMDKFYNRASLIYIDIKDGDIRREYASLTSMMMTEAECYERGINSYKLPLLNENKNYQSYLTWRKYNISLIDMFIRRLSNNFSLKILESFEVNDGMYRYKDLRIVEFLIHLIELKIPENITSEEYIEYMDGRSLATHYLGEQGYIKAVPTLIDLLQDKYESTRLEAVHSLHKLKDERARQPLIKILQDSNKKVRLEAARALADLDAYSKVRETVTIALDEIENIDNAEPQLMPQKHCISTIGSIGPIEPIGPIKPIEPIEPIRPIRPIGSILSLLHIH